MKKIKLLKWSIIGVVIAVMIASIVIVSITERTFFYYAIATLCPLLIILSVWLIFQQKENATPVNSTSRSNEDDTRSQRVTQIIEMEEEES